MKNWWVTLILVGIFFSVLFYNTYYNASSGIAIDESLEGDSKYLLSGPDPYYNMRIVKETSESGVYKFYSEKDDLLNYPVGRSGSRAPLLNMIALGFSNFLTPFMDDVDAIGYSMQFVPALFGALLIIPVYFIGKILFNKKAALSAAFFIAIIPINSFIRLLRLSRFSRLIRVNTILRFKGTFQLYRIPAFIRIYRKKVNRFLKKSGFIYMLYIFVVVIITCSVIMSLLEKQSIGDSLWWCIVTTTTVGYGDIAPVTTSGRIVAVVLMIYGISFIAMLTSTITAYLTERANLGITKEQAETLKELIESLDDDQRHEIREYIYKLKKQNKLEE